jgi:glycine/D-amino acid oxidase-like deaminating enzyme
MNNGSAIVLGANAGQADLIRYLKQRGWEVTSVSGRRVGDPGDIRRAWRVVMTPLSAKLLLRALHENIGRYEAAFGEISVPNNSTLAESLFRPPHPPEPPKE